MTRCATMRSRMLAAIGGHATESERVELEAHLESCTDCRAEHAALEPVRQLRGVEVQGLSDIARERIRRAIRAEAGGKPSARTSMRRRPTTAAIVLGAALAAAAALVAVLRGGGSPSEGWAVEGDVHRTDAGGFVSRRGGSIELDGLTVTLEPGTEIAWRPPTTPIGLRRGAVVVDVVPGRYPRFRVQASRFTAEVHGTLFRVDERSVSTLRGVVVVLDRSEARLAELHAGHRWDLPDAPTTTRAAQEPRTSPATPANVQADVTAADVPIAAPSALTSTERLQRVRNALARGRAAEARTLLAPLRDASREVAVEARSLMAESYLVEGRYGEAIRGYRSVVRDFGGTAEAESALYAIAQLESESGSHEDAVAALRRYLDRYPRGRFGDEARRRLERLETAAGPPR